jgi:peptide/nickel transport system permease protein
MATVEPAVLGPARVRGRAGTHLLRGLPWSDRLALGSLALITLIALIGPFFAPHDPRLAAGPSLQAPSASYPFGTDNVGRDLFSAVLYGVRSTWLSALAVIASGVIIGGIVGLVAGANGGWIDNLLMRITDLFLALPAPILAIAVVVALGPSLAHTLIALAILWWPYYARLVRAEIRALAARPHIEAARLAKTSSLRRLTRHLLPGAIPIVIIAASLDIANLIIVLAGLSFLGLGAQPPAPELGSMTANGLPYLLTNWWIPIIPGIAVFVLSLVGNLAGDSLRDLVDR